VRSSHVWRHLPATLDQRPKGDIRKENGTGKPAKIRKDVRGTFRPKERKVDETARTSEKPKHKHHRGMWGVASC